MLRCYEEWMLCASMLCRVNVVLHRYYGEKMFVLQRYEEWTFCASILCRVDVVSFDVMESRRVC